MSIELSENKCVGIGSVCGWRAVGGYVPSEPGGSGSSGCAESEAPSGGGGATLARDPHTERDARNDPDLPTSGRGW